MSSDYDMFQLSDDELDEDFEVDEEGVASSSDDQACEQPNDGPSIIISSYVYTPLPPEDEMEDETELMPGHGPVHGMEDETTNDGQDEADDSNDELDDSGDSECKHCDRIEVDLEVVVLGDERQKHPTYDVLSYVWGSKAKPCFVYVSKEKRILRITRNLDEAIRHLRYLDCPRYIWIDALCIDQGNPEERSRQVAYMGRIYWTAPSVVVWLGPRADNSDGALETLQDIGNQAQFNLIRAQMTGTTDLNHVYRGTPTRDLPIAGELFIAIAALLQRPWFERMWIRQEVFKANDKKSQYRL
ncbi:hypothetical protein SLS53_001867 [Cytospora paraplurivora]|uniref:Heterokaryon incompatibility domain-containing protein n=1 Tax=Cytospora paraplurivora TaxID=2898453 RepID=A0AAN9UEZ4_9PEZI